MPKYTKYLVVILYLNSWILVSIGKNPSSTLVKYRAHKEFIYSDTPHLTSQFRRDELDQTLILSVSFIIKFCCELKDAKRSIEFKAYNMCEKEGRKSFYLKSKGTKWNEKSCNLKINIGWKVNEQDKNSTKPMLQEVKFY